MNKGKNIMQRLNQIEKEEKDVGKGRKARVEKQNTQRLMVFRVFK